MTRIANPSISSDADLQGHEAEAAERHTLLRETVASLMQASGGVGRIRSLRGHAPGFDTVLWKKMAELGWLSILVPEAHGGLGLGIRDMCVVAHEAGKWVAPEPLTASTVLATGTLWRGANPSLRDTLLPQAMTGDLCLALAWQENVRDIDFTAPPQTRAARTSDGFTISGCKRFVQTVADGYVVSAANKGNLGLYWIPRATRGITATLVPLADGTFAADLDFDAVSLPPDALIAEGDHAQRVLAAAIADAMIVVSAELLGNMEAALAQTLEFLRTRVQFDQPIGAFQALQHRAVDLFMAKELASCALTDAIDAMEADTDEAHRADAATRAKYRCSKSAIAITRAAVHLHGAMGFTDECNIGLYLKRAIVLGAWLGNHELHLQKLSDQAAWLARTTH